MGLYPPRQPVSVPACCCCYCFVTWHINSSSSAVNKVKVIPTGSCIVYQLIRRIADGWISVWCSQALCIGRSAGRCSTSVTASQPAAADTLSGFLSLRITLETAGFCVRWIALLRAGDARESEWPRRSNGRPTRLRLLANAVIGVLGLGLVPKSLLPSLCQNVIIGLLV